MDKSHSTLNFEKPIRDLEAQLEALNRSSKAQNLDVAGEIVAIEKKIEATKREIYSNLTAWQRVQISRHPQRPFGKDYIESLFDDFQEFHGDRFYGDDHALIGGTAFFEGKTIMLLAQQKGRNTKENIFRNFGMPQPEGYRKAHRLMKMAEKFKIPVISFIDTPGAYPGLGAEERHVAEAIAVNQQVMSRLNVPIISIIIGEGGSGGALGISLADRILVLENAYFSVISPEGCAAILWRDRTHAPKAAEALRLSAEVLINFGIADAIVPEPLGGAHRDHIETAGNVRSVISKHLKELRSLSTKTLKERRYRKYRAIAVLDEPGIEEKTSEFPTTQSKAVKDKTA